MIYRSGTAKELVNGTHSCPLERSKRLRHKEGCADGNLAFSVSLILWDLIIPLCNLLSQLEATQCGLPMEFYFFVKDKVWVNYEHILAEIMEHAYALSAEFGLKIYQQYPEQ